MHNPPDTSIAAQLADLREQIRDVRAVASSVVDPTTGISVPLSTLAFGRDAVSAAGTVTLTTNDNAWQPDPDALTVWAEAFAGELLVTVAAKLVVAGNKATMAMSSELYGPTTARGFLTARPTGPAPSVVATPSNDRALSVLMDNTGQSQSLGGSYAFLHAGLAPGWYRVRPLYQLSGAVGQPNGISGTATGRTVIADPR